MALLQEADGFCHNNLMAILSVGVCQIVERGVLQQVIQERMPNYAGCDDCERLMEDFYHIYLEQNKPMTQRLRHIMAQAMKGYAKAEEKAEKEKEAEPEVVAAPKPVIPLPAGGGFKVFLPILQSLLAVLFLAVLALCLGQFVLQFFLRFFHRGFPPSSFFLRRSCSWDSREAAQGPQPLEDGAEGEQKCSLCTVACLLCSDKTDRGLAERTYRWDTCIEVRTSVT